jgi:hypothetical protein
VISNSRRTRARLAGFMLSLSCGIGFASALPAVALSRFKKPGNESFILIHSFQVGLHQATTYILQELTEGISADSG